MTVKIYYGHPLGVDWTGALGSGDGLYYPLVSSSPNDGDVDVPVDSDVVITATNTDTEDPINPALTVITVNSAVAWSADAPQNGWSGSRSSVVDGYIWTLTPPAPFAGYSLVNLQAYVENDLGLSTTLESTFQIADDAGPTISGRSPAPGSIDVLLSEHILVTATDTDSGVDAATMAISVGGATAWLLGSPASGWSGSCTPVAGGYSWELWPDTGMPPFTLELVELSVSDTTGNSTSNSWSFTTKAAYAIRVPSPSLYADELRAATTAIESLVINTVPEDTEAGVSRAQPVVLHVVRATIGALPATVRVYITQSSTGEERLAYDQASGGFQTGFNGPLSSAVSRPSPGSGFDDELILVIDHEAEWESLEVITVRVDGGGLL